MLVRIFTTIKEIPEFRCASSAKGGRWWSETPSFLRMQESLHSFVVSKRTSIKRNKEIIYVTIFCPRKALI